MDTSIYNRRQKILSKIVENLHFSVPLNFLPMSLKSIHKSFDLTCKNCYYLHFFKTANISDYVGPYSDPKYCGRLNVRWCSSQIFGILGEAKYTYSVISISSWTIAWTMSMYWDRNAVHLGIYFKIWSNCHCPVGNHHTVHLQKVFRSMCLNLNTVGIIPTGGN